MPTLRLTVHWLAGDTSQASYHGQEWPPAPARIFRALIAGAHRPGGAGQRGIEALQRLECLDPPVVLGPSVERLSPVRSAVPNNDTDCVMDLHHKGRTTQARKKVASLYAMRLRTGWAVPGPVEYRWHFPKADPDPEAYSLLADGLTVFGQGADLACAEANWSETEPARWGYVWRPDEIAGTEAMAVPSRGEVERLEASYQDARSRIRGNVVSSAREPRVDLANYQDPLAPPAMRWQAFNLRTADDSAALAVPGEEALRVTGMVRHAIHRAARQAGLDDSTIGALMGHDGPGRLFALALGNVGHAWADGRIRRVMVAAPPAVSQDIWSSVMLRLTAAELIDTHSGAVQGLLAPISRSRDDRILWRFTDASTTWSSASPVVLPGFDTRRGRARTHKAVRRLLKHAKIPSEAVRRVRLDDAPQLLGCSGPRTSVPHYLKGYPIKFVTLEFHRPIRGPIFLGAGAGAGIGMLTHCDHSNGDMIPGSARENQTTS